MHPAFQKFQVIRSDESAGTNFFLGRPCVLRNITAPVYRPVRRETCLQIVVKIPVFKVLPLIKSLNECRFKDIRMVGTDYLVKFAQTTCCNPIIPIKENDVFSSRSLHTIVTRIRKPSISFMHSYYLRVMRRILIAYFSTIVRRAIVNKYGFIVRKILHQYAVNTLANVVFHLIYRHYD